MILRLSNLKLNPGYSPEDLERAVRRRLAAAQYTLNSVNIAKRSLDARKKDNIRYVITADADISCSEKNLTRLLKTDGITQAPEDTFTLPEQGPLKLPGKIYVVGSGPAGLFCAYFLAKYGYGPVLIERGGPVEERVHSVNRFLEGGKLDSESNVQFGEGGAGTFSDGKLSYSGKDRTGRGRLVLKTFVRHGAKEEVLYEAKPHIGTDCLQKIIHSMREEIIKNGGEVRFNTKLEGIECADAFLGGIYLSDRFSETVHFEPCKTLVLAPGHSARDTFEMIFKKGMRMQAKPFAVGVRVQHSQEKINEAQYTHDYREKYPTLPPADYKLTAHTKSGRSVYSFCMCPGGYVINSSSEPAGLCINGMSYSGRSGRNANSAIVVNVDTRDFNGDKDVLAGIRFQRDLEKKAYDACGGRIPVQRLSDFNAGCVTRSFGSVSCECRGETGFADINGILPEFICGAIKEAFSEFGKSVQGFDDPDALLSAVEARTSSPVRILRDENLESSIKGIFPCGEGAGYAGGIMSAAMDGIKVFEEIYGRFRP